MNLFKFMLCATVIIIHGAVFAQVPQVDQPGICFECHPDMEDFSKKPHVHGAFESGECSECHNPHASKHAALLGDQVLPLCFSCHDSIKDELKRSSTHMPVLSGECTTCHDPHASENSSLLKQGTIAMCKSCHNSLDKWLGNEYVHAPVLSGDCFDCHGPHGEINDKLLTQKIPQSCYECHDSVEDIKSSHRGYDISDSNCIACHDPHSSSIPSLLRPNQHAPFKGNNCNACHKTNSKNSFELVASNKELCLNCHKSIINRELKHQHNLNDDTSCMHCHNPHASASNNLLHNEQEILCMSCHFNEEGSQNKTKYITHKGTDCSNCHLPHGAENDRYLNSVEIELCLKCHTKSHQASHPLGDEIIDPRNEQPVTCLSCHTLHGAEFEKYFALNPSMDLCIQCHKR